MVIDLSPKHTHSCSASFWHDATRYLVGHDKSVGVFASIQGEVVRIAIDETTKARIQHASRATVTHLIFMTGRT